MAEYIERQKAIDLFSPVDPENDGSDGTTLVCLSINYSSAEIESKLSDMPAEDVAPVRHGRWLFVTKGQMTSAWCCSECGRTVVITCDEELRQSKLEKEYPFCHCGAKMDSEVPENETI